MMRPVESRIGAAESSMLETRPVREIAAAVGFEDELYFSRRFRLEQGRPPSDYRKIYALRSQRQP